MNWSQRATFSLHKSKLSQYETYLLSLKHNACSCKSLRFLFAPGCARHDRLALHIRHKTWQITPATRAWMQVLLSLGRSRRPNGGFPPHHPPFQSQDEKSKKNRPSKSTGEKTLVLRSQNDFSVTAIVAALLPIRYRYFPLIANLTQRHPYLKPALDTNVRYRCSHCLIQTNGRQQTNIRTNLFARVITEMLSCRNFHPGFAARVSAEESEPRSHESNRRTADIYNQGPTLPKKTPLRRNGESHKATM